jgi:hypothetical protein
MRNLLLALVLLLTVGNGILVWKAAGPVGPRIIHNQHSTLPVWHTEYQTAKSVSYDSGEPEDDELEGVQCPVPMKDRVRNYTGIQCVYSSIEMLGRWAEEPKLMNPPLTSRGDCKGYSGPSAAASRLKKYGVKFEQEYRSREAGIRLMKKAMRDGRACLWGVPGHAMVLIHYDEENNVVKYVDNSDRSLRIQTITISRFKARWDTWILVIYADNDLFPNKINPLARRIPISDRNNPQGMYPKDYIPMPRRIK